MKLKIIILLVIILQLVGCSEKQEQHMDSLEMIQEKGELIVGIYPYFAPMIYKEENGDFTGHDLELIERIAKELDVKPKYKEMLFPELFIALKNKEVDVIISSITITAERSKHTLFSVPYFDGGQIIIIKADNNEISSVEDLKDKKVGTLKGTTGEIATREYANESEIITLVKREVLTNLKEYKIIQ